MVSCIIAKCIDPMTGYVAGFPLWGVWLVALYVLKVAKKGLLMLGLSMG